MKTWQWAGTYLSLKGHAWGQALGSQICEVGAGIVAWSPVWNDRVGPLYQGKRLDLCLGTGQRTSDTRQGFLALLFSFALSLWLPCPQGGLGKVRTDREAKLTTAWERCQWQLVKGCLGIQFLWPTPLSWFCLVLTGLYRKTKTETQGNYEKSQMGCCLVTKSS